MQMQTDVLQQERKNRAPGQSWARVAEGEHVTGVTWALGDTSDGASAFLFFLTWIIENPF